MAFFSNETLRVGVGVGVGEASRREASRREASRREASRREGVLAVAYGKPQSVYDKLGEVGYFCVSPNVFEPHLL
ncbi:MAG: hypothetical protein RMY29_032955 [Nostoc sp. CreGUA01]